MADPPIAPKLAKGAIVAFNLPVPTPKVIPFQYNPENLSRSLEAQTAGGEEGAAAESTRLAGAPIETIKLECELDATDRLEKGEETAAEMGIYPQLAILETLLYPSSAVVIANTILLSLGTIEILPTQGPFTLLIWGAKRILPVRITEFSVTEEAFDTSLNPIRAKVSRGLRVLSYSDLDRAHPGYYLFLAHQVVKETMAGIAGVDTLEAVVGGDVKLV
jgi:hypothetical protein